MRNRSPEDIIDLGLRAFTAEPDNAMKILFHIRDVREGLGERRTFRILLRRLIEEGRLKNPKKIIKLIYEYGRYDDAIAVMLKTDMERAFFLDLKTDLIEPKRPLAAKWLPKESSGNASKNLAIYFADKLDMTRKAYRQAVSKLRKPLNLVETDLSDKDYSEIVYEHVPSRAMMLYRKAFEKHDSARFNEYLKLSLIHI